MGRFPGNRRECRGQAQRLEPERTPAPALLPELGELAEQLPPGSAVDGEIVIQRGGSLDFDALQMRLHPAESRIRKLSAEIPAEFVCFDVLLWNKKALHKLPLEERRAQVEKLLRHLTRESRHEAGGEVARPARRRRVRRSHRQAARPPLHAGLARRPQGEAAQDRRRRRGGRDVEREGRQLREPSAWPVRRRRSDPSRRRRLGRCARSPRGDRGTGQAAARRRAVAHAARRAEPLAAEGRARVERSSPSSSSRSSTTSGRASAFATAPASFASAPTRIRRTAPSSRCAGSRSAATLLLRGF